MSLAACVRGKVIEYLDQKCLKIQSYLGFICSFMLQPNTQTTCPFTFIVIIITIIIIIIEIWKW
jgi:hypothetical protein